MTVSDLKEYLESMEEDFGDLPVIFGLPNGTCYEIKEPPEQAIVNRLRDEFAFTDGLDANCIVIG